MEFTCLMKFLAEACLFILGLNFVPYCTFLSGLYFHILYFFIKCTLTLSCLRENCKSDGTRLIKKSILQLMHVLDSTVKKFQIYLLIFEYRCCNYIEIMPARRFEPCTKKKL